jgi:phosphoribosylglycinamide formyltransferase 1
MILSPLEDIQNGVIVMQRRRVLVFASGTPSGGGAGFKNLALEARYGDVSEIDIVGVVSHHELGGVRTLAKELRVPFIHMPSPYSAHAYRSIVAASKADFVALLGWIKHVEGLDPRTTFNIHPAPLPEFGGEGMYGRAVHERVLAAYHNEEITHTAVCVHFVTASYDLGPVFFRVQVPILANDTATTLQLRVSVYERVHHPRITQLVVRGQISWDGTDPTSLSLPEGYRIDHEF